MDGRLSPGSRPQSSEELSGTSSLRTESSSVTSTSNNSFSSTASNISVPLIEEDKRIKRKRNKPTHSCTECVKRKSKCKRERPICSACIERKTAQLCYYIDEEAPLASKPPRHERNPSLPLPVLERSNFLPLPDMYRPRLPLPINFDTDKLPPIALSIPTEHPFEQAAAMRGSLRDLIIQLPSREQAEVLLKSYFESIDPIYPMIEEKAFMTEYTMSHARPQDASWDEAWYARLSAMLAAGLQAQQQAHRGSGSLKHVNFMLACSYRALSLAGYHNNSSIVLLEAMLILVNTMANAGFMSDSCAFSGVLVKQAHSTALHRSPTAVAAGLDVGHQQERLRVWQAIRMQDCALGQYMKKPPLTTLTDVNVTHLHARGTSKNDESDMHYIKGLWEFTSFEQKLWEPLAVDISPVPTREKRIELVTSINTICRLIVPDLMDLNDNQVVSLSYQYPRVAKQLLFLRVSYWHDIMWVSSLDKTFEQSNHRRYSDETLDAAMRALDAFLLLHALYGYKARVWWVSLHRAYSEALILGQSLLRSAHTERDRMMGGYIKQVIAILEMEIAVKTGSLQDRLTELKEHLARAGVDWRHNSI